MTAAVITGPRTGSYVRVGVAAAAVAAAATTTVAAAGHAAGISLDVGGEPIPLPGFTQLTAVAALLGLALATVLVRTARNARRTFVRTTLVLTALSLIPDLIVPADLTTRVLLMITHLVAAAIVIPAIARRLPS
jgi:hypothetical protein